MSRRATLTLGVLLAWLLGFCSTAAPALAVNCSASMTSVVFGSIDVVTGQPEDSTGTLTMNCSGIGNKPMRFCVSIGGGSAFDSTSRLMNGQGTAQLRYQLYTDAAHTIPWGSWLPQLYGGGFQWDVPASGGNATFTTTVYGRILGSQQLAQQGVYTSILGLTATFDNTNPQTCPEAGVGNTTTSFIAAVAVTTTCSVSASSLNFGTLSTLTKNVDATSTITAQCANGAPYNIGLDAGTGAGATVAVRKMTQGNNTLNYSLYSDPAHTTVWGNTVSTDTVAGSGNGTAQSYIVYGRIPPQSIQGPGSYTDTIVVTLTF